MVLLVRNTPIKVYYVTGVDAKLAREVAGDDGDRPCFTTEEFGYDGFTWDTPGEFESEHKASFPEQYK